MLLPVLAQARAKARSASCLSNTKQLVPGCLMYADDNDGIVPNYRPYYSGNCSPNNSAFWQHFVVPQNRHGLWRQLPLGKHRRQVALRDQDALKDDLHRRQQQRRGRLVAWVPRREWVMRCEPVFQGVPQRTREYRVCRWALRVRLSSHRPWRDAQTGICVVRPVGVGSMPVRMGGRAEVGVLELLDELA